MSAVLATASPRRIKATRRRRRKVASGPIVQRYYDPQIGRFLSRDPAASEFNRYNYASNNPYRLVDPDGRAAKKKDDEPPPPPPPPKPDITKLPRRPIATVTGPTKDEAAKKAQAKIRGEERKKEQEYCGCIEPSADGFTVAIVTNDAATGCYPGDCSDDSIHNHPQKDVKLTIVDEILSGGERRAGKLFSPGNNFSESDYTFGPGYLITGPTLRHQDGKGTEKDVK